jgi:hypothetical protein
VSWKSPSAPVYGPTTSSNATLSLIFGIVAWTLLPIVAAVIAVITGHMARAEIRAAGGSIGGWGQATAGLVLGYIQLIPLLVAAVVILAGLAIAGVASLGVILGVGGGLLGIGAILATLIGL